MNIQMMQMLNIRKEQFKPNSSPVKNQPNEQPFDQMLKTAVQGNQEKAPEIFEENAMEKAVEIVETTNVKDVFEKLNIEIDESGQLAIIDGEVVGIDEMLNLETLSEALGMTMEDLQLLLEQFTGEQITDISSLLEAAPNMMVPLMAALNGDHQAPSKDALKVMELLKLVETVGSKTDSTYLQSVKLLDLKQSLQQVVTQSVAVQQTTQGTTTFAQLMKSENENSPPVILQQQTVETKVVTVTLPAEKPAQSEALLKEMQNLINRSQLSNSNGQLRLMLKLFPENLGQVRIEIVQKDGIMTARLMASTALGKELLDSNLHQLKNTLVAQNIQLDRIDITQSLQDAERNSSDQHLFNNFFRQQAEQEDSNEDENEEESKSFSEFLNEEVEV